MKAYTFQEAQDLGYGLSNDDAEYTDFYGEQFRTMYIQADVAYEYSSRYVANKFKYGFAHILLGPTSQKHSWALYVGFAFVLLCGAIRKFIFPIIESRLPRGFNRFLQLVRAHVMLAGALDKHVEEPIGWSVFTMQIPSRLHTAVVMSYVTVNIVLLFTPYLIVQPNVFYLDLGWPFSQYCRYLADRTGILSFGSTPLVILLAARNSPVTWFSGASFSTLQIYHRWIARITFLNAFLHTVAYTVSSLMGGSEIFHSYFSDPYWQWGWAAFSGGCVLVCLSFRFIRQAFYEVFLILHIAGILLWIVGCYYHVYLLGGHENMKLLRFIYAAVALWALDRFLRPLRLLWLNAPRRGWFKGTVDRKRLFDAEGHISKCGLFVRVVVRPQGTFPAWAARPGSYVFASHPSWWQGSHPFTLAWPQHLAIDEVDAGAFELLLKKHDGYTKALFKRAPMLWRSEEHGPQSVVPLRMCVEGPYGSGHSLVGFDVAVLIAGGSGISAVTAHLADFAKHARQGTLRLQKIQLVWAIRDVANAEILAVYLQRFQEMVGEKACHELLEVFVYHTAGHHHALATEVEGPAHHIKACDIKKDDGSSSAEKYTPQEVAVEDGVHNLLGGESKSSKWRLQVHHGRPAIAEHVELLDDTLKSAVLVCGPLSMCDDARLCVKQKLARGLVKGGDIELVDESFTW